MRKDRGSMYEHFVKQTPTSTSAYSIPDDHMVVCRSPEYIGYADWKYICCTSFHLCSCIMKQFEHVIKMVNVNPVSSFEHIRSYLSTRCCILSFKAIGLLVPKKKIFEDFTISGSGSHLGHVTQNIWTNFHPNSPWRLNMKFGFNRPSVFWEKEVWKCWIWVTLDKGQWMTLTSDVLKGSCTNLVDCIYQLWYHRISEKSIVLPFSNTKA